MRGWRRYLLPPDERDPAFRKEVSRVSVVGLQAVSLICTIGPAFMLGVTLVLYRLGYQSRLWLEPDLAIIGAGLLAAPFAFFPRLHRHARLTGWVLGYCVGLIFIVAPVAAPDAFPGAKTGVPMSITLVTLVGVAAMPVKPLQTLGLGLGLWGTYVAALELYPERSFIADETPGFLAALILVILICTGLTAVVYHQRAEAFRARELVLKAQARLALSESAAAQGRLAAALSHELNSPIGIINSSVDTLSLALEKYANPPGIDSLRDVLASTKRSCARLAELVRRMQRFTNLDRTHEAAIDLSSLLTDTVDILRPEIQKKAEITMQLEPLPPFRCDPREMTAVFSNLLMNSSAAVAEKGKIQVRSGIRSGHMVIEIADDGRGIARDKLTSIFEPSFAVVDGRVATAHWGLFTCRNIVIALGGEIHIESVEGEGTKVRITLPTSERQLWAT